MRDGSRLQADILLYNGKFITLNEQQPFASALAVKEGRLVKVGNYDEAKLLLGENTNVIDLAGRTVVPGFIDSNIHLISLGLGMQVTDRRHSSIGYVPPLMYIERVRAGSASGPSPEV